MKLIVLRLKITWFLSLLSFFAYAQEPAYRNYTTSDGLASNNVYSVMQDREGFIWFATDNGVSRFDGTHFKNYTLADGLTDNDVLKIAEDAEGRLWFLTFNGKLSFYQNDKIYNSTNCELLRKIKFTDFITCFYQDSKKNIWICSIDYSIAMISASGEVKIYKNIAKIMYMWEDKGQIIFSSTKSIYFFNANHFTHITLPTAWACGLFISKDSLLMLKASGGFETYKIYGKLRPVNTPLKLKSEIIRNIYDDNKKNIWLSTLSGAIEFRNGIISPDYEYDYLKNYSITSVFRDHDNNLWFSSFAKGVFIIPSTAIYLFNEKSGLVENDISAVAFINDSTLLLGSNNGSIQILNPSGVEEYGHSLVAPTGRVLKIGNDRHGTIWILTEKAIYKYRNGKLTKLNFIDQTTWYKTLFISHDGTPLIGWGRGLKKIIDNAVSIIYADTGVNRVYAIEQLDNNDFLLGTNKGLYHFKDGKMLPDNNGNPLLIHRINALTFDADSTLWIGTNDYGLLSISHGVVKSYTTSNHMLSNHCNSLFVDSNKIYVATDNGLNVLHKEKNLMKINSYSLANGLVSNRINQVVKMGKNTIILATDKGLVEFDERKLPHSSISTPYINAIVINDTLKPLATNYNFKYSENNIRIDFGAINFNSAGNIYYRYKLEGIDADWNYTTYTSVKYSYLHPGNYNFIVATQNADGSWNPKTASLGFYIETPWWQTWWFKSVAGLILIGIIVLVIKWRISVYKERINRERALAESELKALRAQINPHFIYNSLNAIQDFILQNQKEDANLYLTKFATLMRSILSYSRSSTVSLEEEIASLQLYLELEALRFNNHFTFRFIVDEQIDTEYVQIPSMILQPYIENAILHGLSPLAGGGKITISFILKNNFLVCVIEDNGIGRKKAAEARSQRVWKGHKSLGMTVTQERIDLLSSHQKQKINMEITDLVDDNNTATGTRVTIYFPLTDQ